MSTENIQKFLMPPEEGGAYTDEKLAALLAHAQDGKLSYHSCCCLIGAATADHPLRGADYSLRGSLLIDAPVHIQKAQFLRYAKLAEEEFLQLGYTSPMQGRQQFTPEAADQCNLTRRKRLIPLIIAEMERREAKRVHSGSLIEDLIGAVEKVVSK